MTSSGKSVLALVVITVLSLTNINADIVQLAISHCNDISGQLEAFLDGTHKSSKAPTPCVPRPEDLTCIGGFANVVHWLQDNSSFRAIPDANILRLSSGNFIGGESGWIPSSSSPDGWERLGGLVRNRVQPTFMALGMKEFGAGVAETTRFVSQIKVGLGNACEVTYNVSSTEEKFCNSIEKNFGRVLLNYNTKGTYEIGIIGFVTPTVERLSLPGKLKFSEIVEAIKRITEKPDIKTFIAIGDGNLEIAKKILEEVPKVKLVIYGAGFSTTNINQYPLPYNNGYIATAGRYGSSVGKMRLEIDTDTGNIKNVTGIQRVTNTPATRNEQGEAAMKDVEDWGKDVEKARNDEVGNTLVNLVGGETCWRRECNLGNIMTDAAVHCILQRYEETFPSFSSLQSIWHGGAFFEDTLKGPSVISKFDIHKWLPYHNKVRLVKVKGRDLWRMFDMSATGIDPEKAGTKDWRQFLQVSNGFEVYYETTSGVPKLTRVRIVHNDDGVPQLDDLRDDQDYYLAIPTFLYEGRGLYDFASQIWEEIKLPNASISDPVFDDNCLEGYITALKYVSVGLEERIWINADSPHGDDGRTCKEQKTAVTVILTIVFFVISLGIIFVGFFYVLPRLRRPSTNAEYPPNQL